MKRVLVLAVVCGLLSCVPPTDDPSQVIDLRVLGVQFEPPELMAPDCRALLALAQADAGEPDISGLLLYARPIDMTWLILDPKGANRDIQYEVRACANQSDYRCDNEGDFVVLGSGSTKAGELKRSFAPGFSFVDNPPDGGLGTPLIAEVAAQDTFRGFGGFRMPIVIHLKAGAEEVYAQKLMVFSCRAFPSMKANVNPVLPGMTYSDVVTRRGGLGDAGIPWGVADVPQFSGKDGGVRLEAVDFSDRQEKYVVPTFELKPLELVESWQISWHADLGRTAPNETGGVGLDGEEGKHFVTWNPLLAENNEKDVNYWFVVRDGRGGQSWMHRKAHWKPAP